MRFEVSGWSLAGFLLSLPVVLFAFSGCEWNARKSPARISDLSWSQIEEKLKESKANTQNGAVVKVWSRGQNVWSRQSERPEGLREAVSQGIDSLMKEHQAEGLVILCLPQKLDFERENLRGQERTRRGLLGARLGTEAKPHWVCPHEVTAQNVDLEQVINKFTLAQSQSGDDPLNFVGEKWSFVELAIKPVAGENLDVTELLRGKNEVKPSDVNRESTSRTAQLMADWLFRSVQDDGRMVYLYQPSLGKEESGNNMIRQFMATVSLVRWANAHPEQKHLRAVIERNFAYNFRQYYREMNGDGVIEYQGSRKLGAMALAALAIHESHLRDKYQKEYLGLQRGILKMWRPDGSFRTHYESAQNDNQNFYPGEALLFWATLFEEKQDPELLGRFRLSFNYYYKVFHKKFPNPAFVPWHTQAYYRVWKLTRDPEMQKAIIQMNDWLVATMQQWDQPGVLADERGQFFSPEHPYGPPHASSTGVYLEGLIDAYRLAVDVGDAARAQRYQVAMVRGIRSIQELQFKTEIDTFYVARPDSVRGALRTSNSDNVIRVDNVQHALMGFINILATLKEEQIQISQPGANPDMRQVARQGLSRPHEMMNATQVSD